MVQFIRGGMQRRFQDVFSILLTAKDNVQVFGEHLELYRIKAFPEAHRRLHLILNLSAKPDKKNPSVNDTTTIDIAPDLMQFGRSFPRILQDIWVADPAEGLVRVSKLDVTDAYHHVTLQPSHVGMFSYIVPLAPDDDVIIIIIDLIFPMVCVQPPKFLCAF